MNEEKLYKVGTVVDDLGRVGMISKVVVDDAKNQEKLSIFKNDSYEISYSNGDTCILRTSSFNRLLKKGQIRIILESD